MFWFNRHSAWLLTLSLALVMVGCSTSKLTAPSLGTSPETTQPTVSFTGPASLATNVAINRPVRATFSEAMNATTVTGGAFTVTGPGVTPVNGTVTYNDGSMTAIFTPASNLAANTVFTATISTAAMDQAGNAMAANKVWTFTTGSTAAAGPGPVNLGSAGDYVILAKSGVSTTGVTSVVGNIGVSPAAATALTGFSQTLDATNQFSTSSLVTGKLYAADYAPPTPANLTAAVLDMETAYTDAAGRTSPDFTELGAGNINGMTLAPGLYTWGTGVRFPSAVTLSGGANDDWIFQIAQGLTVGNSAIVTLSGGAQAKNVFWQVGGQATLGTASNFKGTILSKTLIAVNTRAVVRGRALAQTAVTLNATAISTP